MSNVYTGNETIDAAIDKVMEILSANNPVYRHTFTIDRKKAENDPVNHPAHYTSGSIECIDFIDSCGYGLDFCLANAIKYLVRCKLKGTCEQDIRKAIWYATHAADGIASGKYDVEENK